MLSEIERIFPTICSNMKLGIEEIVSVRKMRKELFNEQYFTNKFWDIILLLYSHEINEIPIDANIISRNLDLNHRSVMRYLKVLFADEIICEYESREEIPFNLACDKLSLTRVGFENADMIVRQTRKIFASNKQA